MSVFLQPNTATPLANPVEDTQTTITDVPAEILHSIFSRLNMQDQNSVRETCKHTYRILGSPVSQLMYKVLPFANLPEETVHEWLKYKGDVKELAYKIAVCLQELTNTQTRNLYKELLPCNIRLIHQIFAIKSARHIVLSIPRPTLQNRDLIKTLANLTLQKLPSQALTLGEEVKLDSEQLDKKIHETLHETLFDWEANYLPAA